MSEPSSSSRQPSRSQVLHSGLAESRQTAVGETVEVPPEGLRGVPYGSSSGSSSSTSAPNRRRVPPRRPPSREEQHQEIMRNFQKRYKVDPIPTMSQLKLWKTVSGFRLSADVCKPRNGRAYVSLGLKRDEDPLLVKKVVVTPQHSDVRVFTPSMEFGVLQLQFAVGFDWSKRTFGASWRCKTKWTRGNKVQRRFKLFTNDNMEVTSFWNFRSELPTVGGQFGSHSSSVQADIGRLYLDFDRLKASFKL